MIKLVEHQVWDDYESDKYTYITEKFDIIGSYQVMNCDTYYYLLSLYVQPPYRGFTAPEFMDDILKTYTDKDIYVQIKKSSALNFYEQYGFILGDKVDEKSFWMFKLKK